MTKGLHPQMSLPPVKKVVYVEKWIKMMCICGCDNCDINAQLGSEPHLKLFTSENVKHPLQIANRDPLIFYCSCWSDIDNGPTNSPWVVLIIAAAAAAA